MDSFSVIWAIGIATFRGGIRDRLIQSLLLAGFLFLLSTIVFSSFSMRQTVEVAINYSLAAVEILTILITLFLGLNLLSREIETRAGYSVLSQPLSRTDYILGKFVGLALLTGVVVFFLTLCAVAGIMVVKIFGHEQQAVNWGNVSFAIVGIVAMSLLLGASTLLFSAVATSAVFPFLSTIAVWFIGQSLQSVKNYIDADLGGQPLAPPLKAIVSGAYYLFPNLSLLDFKVFAIYAIPIPLEQVLYALMYGLLYTAILLCLAAVIFRSRDMV